MNFFEDWDDDWGEAAVAEEPVPEPVQQQYAPKSDPQPIFEEPVETAPAQKQPAQKQPAQQQPAQQQPVGDNHHTASLQDAWYQDDGWNTFSSDPIPKETPAEPTHVLETVAPEPLKTEAAPVVQSRVAQPRVSPRTQPRASPIAAPIAQPTRAAPIAQPRAQNRQPQQEKPPTSSWGKNQDTSLFANQAPRQTKQQKPKKPVAQKQAAKRTPDKRKPPITNKPKLPAEMAEEDREEVVAESAALSRENKSLRQEVEDLRTQFSDMHQRLMHLEHSKRLLYNSVCTLNSSGDSLNGKLCWTDDYGGDILPAQRIAYQLTEDGTGLTIMNDGLYEITFNSFGKDPFIQINNETYATGHTNNSSSYLSICVYVAEKPVITCHVTNPVVGNACDHWLCIRRFPS